MTNTNDLLGIESTQAESSFLLVEEDYSDSRRHILGLLHKKQGDSVIKEILSFFALQSEILIFFSIKEDSLKVLADLSKQTCQLDREFVDFIFSSNDNPTLYTANLENLPVQVSNLLFKTATRSLLLAKISQDKETFVLMITSKAHYVWSNRTKEFVREVLDYLLLAVELCDYRNNLMESQHRYEDMFKNSLHGIYQSTPEGRFIAVNPALVEMLGYDSAEELLQINIAEDLYVKGRDREPLKEILQQEGFVRGHEQRLRRKDGRILIMKENARAVRNSKGTIIYYEGTLEDITEVKLLEEQLLQTQKMESVGTLAGGIAHDFNNLLAGILGYVSVLKQQVGGDLVLGKSVLMVESLSKRAAELTSNLLSFSRSSKFQVSVLNLNRIVTEVVSLLEHTIDKRISIIANYSDNIRNIEADSGQLHQAILNVCLNARDAMPTGGKLYIETAEMKFDTRQLLAYPNTAAGNYICLTLTDTGIGMSSETISRIFEPFFTTKSVGKGTGLGLAMVYGIVRKHGGFIEVKSSLGRGTTFKLYFPTTDKEETSIFSQEVICLDPATETVAVIDDEEYIRDLMYDILSESGYKVITAEDGEEAIKLFEKYGSEIDLIITDIVMPKLTIEEIVSVANKLVPSAKLLICSGFADLDKVESVLKDRHLKFLQKPFFVEELLLCVRRILTKEE
ncbi:MAG: PAS domain S-box protein [Blastocatellia bacterium]|nr:PAS domain S-box protein [Blastocatellia bacterium]